MAPEPRGPFSLHAWVFPGMHWRVTPEGTTSFQHIYINRPKGARYAVAGYYNVTRADHDYLVWDLFNVMRNPMTGAVYAPNPKLTHTDLNAAIMATVLLFDEGR